MRVRFLPVTYIEVSGLFVISGSVIGCHSVVVNFMFNIKGGAHSFLEYALPQIIFDVRGF